MHRKGRRNVRDTGRTPSGMDKGIITGERPRHTTVGETGKFDKTGVSRGATPSGTDLDNDGATAGGRGGV